MSELGWKVLKYFYKTMPWSYFDNLEIFSHCFFIHFLVLIPFISLFFFLFLSLSPFCKTVSEDNWPWKKEKIRTTMFSVLLPLGTDWLLRKWQKTENRWRYYVVTFRSRFCSLEASLDSCAGAAEMSRAAQAAWADNGGPGRLGRLGSQGKLVSVIGKKPPAWSWW